MDLPGLCKCMVGKEIKGCVCLGTSYGTDRDSTEVVFVILDISTTPISLMNRAK